MSSPAVVSPRAEFYRRLSGDHMTPLWEVLGTLVPEQPRSPCVPACWPYATVRPMLMEAGRLITAREAERRVLVLENPGLRGLSSITRSLYAGLQLILPGEVAPSHRHTQSALRFVLEGTGAYTAVDGERTTMHPGDFIVTPSWTYHDHGNPGKDPVVWLDGLDIPTIAFFDAGFAERYSGDTTPLTKAEGDSAARFGRNLLPVDHTAARPSTPLLSYPYETARAALERLSRTGPIHPTHGVKLRYANPATGGPPMPTIGAYIQLLPRGFRGAGRRSTDGTVYTVVEGRGLSHVGESVFEWGPRDVFVVPAWCAVRHEAEAESVLFSFSDRPAQEFFGVWREEMLS